MLSVQLNLFLKEIERKAWLLIMTGTIAWSLTMVKSGLVYSYGIGFWGPNGHDGVWHIALANSLAKGSWSLPMFASEAIKNYHFGFDLLLAILHKITFIPIMILYFQILPPIFALLTGVFVYKFVYLWQKDKAKAYWALFFTYFSGSFGWIITFIKSGRFEGESLFWSQQALSTLVNPPYALSLIFVFAGLYFLVKGVETSKKKKTLSTIYYLLSTFLFGFLILIKVYAGILVLSALFTSGIWMMIQRKGIAVMKIFTGALIISILIFPKLELGATGVVTFKPFWFLETMMSFPDRVGWQKFGEAMVNYKLGGVWLKGILAYFVAFLIFLAGNFGIRIIGLWKVIDAARDVRKLGIIEVFIFLIIGAGILLPMLFLQKGTAWNTIQFFYYSLALISILAGISFVDVLRKLKFSVFTNRMIEVTLILLTIPVLISTLRHYLPPRPPAMISSEELKALNFLSKQPNGVILTQPFDKLRAEAAIDNPPRPLYLYESTAYVSAFSGKPIYLEDEVNLEITGYDWRERREELEKILGYKDIRVLRGFFRENNISYIYWIKNNVYGNFWEEKDLNKIFQNSEVIIYSVM